MNINNNNNSLTKSYIFVINSTNFTNYLRKLTIDNNLTHAVLNKILINTSSLSIFIVYSENLLHISKTLETIFLIKARLF